MGGVVTSNRDIFIEELVAIRGIKRETALKILNMESSLRNEILIALRDAFEKGKVQPT